MKSQHQTQIDLLCEELRGIYASHRESMTQRNVNQANNLYVHAVKTLREIRHVAGPNYQDVLRRLLVEPADDVRSLVAADALWEIPAEAERVLSSISETGVPGATIAHYTLSEWKDGKLVRPTDLEF